MAHTSDDWADINKTKEEKNLLLEQRGGITEDICLWADCGKHCVKGVVIASTTYMRPEPENKKLTMPSSESSETLDHWPQ